MAHYYIHLSDKIELTQREILDEEKIPSLSAQKIARGVIHPDRLPDFDGSKISKGFISDERIGSLDSSKLVGVIPDGLIPSTIPRFPDTETGAVALHEAASNPHPQYAFEDHYHPYPSFDGLNWSWKQSTAPPTRPDGTALAINDEWFDLNDRLTWLWNGTYWTSKEPVRALINATSIGTTAGFGLLPAPLNGYNVLLEHIAISGTLSWPQNTTDRWNVSLERVGAGGIAVGIANLDMTGFSIATGSIGIRESIISGLHQDVTALGIRLFRVAFYKNSAAGNFNNISLSLRYRLVKP